MTKEKELQRLLPLEAGRIFIDETTISYLHLTLTSAVWRDMYKWSIAHGLVNNVAHFQSIQWLLQRCAVGAVLGPIASLLVSIFLRSLNMYHTLYKNKAARVRAGAAESRSFRAGVFTYALFSSLLDLAQAEAFQQFYGRSCPPRQLPDYSTDYSVETTFSQSSSQSLSPSRSLPIGASVPPRAGQLKKHASHLFVQVTTAVVMTAIDSKKSIGEIVDTVFLLTLIMTLIRQTQMYSDGYFKEGIEVGYWTKESFVEDIATGFLQQGNFFSRISLAALKHFLLGIIGDFLLVFSSICIFHVVRKTFEDPNSDGANVTAGVAQLATQILWQAGQWLWGQFFSQGAEVWKALPQAIYTAPRQLARTSSQNLVTQPFVYSPLVNPDEFVDVATLTATWQRMGGWLQQKRLMLFPNTVYDSTEILSPKLGYFNKNHLLTYSQNAFEYTTSYKIDLLNGFQNNDSERVRGFATKDDSFLKILSGDWFPSSFSHLVRDISDPTEPRLESFMASFINFETIDTRQTILGQTHGAPLFFVAGKNKGVDAQIGFCYWNMAIRSHLNTFPQPVSDSLPQDFPKLPKLNMPNRYYAIHVQTEFVLIFIDSERFLSDDVQKKWLTETYNKITGEYTTNTTWQKPWWILISHNSINASDFSLPAFHVHLKYGEASCLEISNDSAKNRVLKIDYINQPAQTFTFSPL